MSSPSVLRVAAAQYSVDHLTSIDQLRKKLERWVTEAAAHGAKLLVFSEFSGMEIASLGNRRAVSDRRSPAHHALGPLPLLPGTRRSEESRQWEITAIQSLLPEFLALHSELAARHRVCILAGSLPVRGRKNELRNRAYFFTSDGGMGYQDKMVPTRWEREYWGLSSGEEVRTFETEFGPIGVTICYDMEFPSIARLQGQAGARIVLAPCCCESLRGYQRVRVGARARALENQAYVIQAPTIGEADWSGVINSNVGTAAIYGPPALAPNVDGIIAEACGQSPQWVYADLDLGGIDRLRCGDGVMVNQDQWDSDLKLRQANCAMFEPAEAQDTSG
jgi:predicted amidohydrolase